MVQPEPSNVVQQRFDHVMVTQSMFINMEQTAVYVQSYY